jgi:hypothetical protein
MRVETMQALLGPDTEAVLWWRGFATADLNAKRSFSGKRTKVSAGAPLNTAATLDLDGRNPFTV